MAQKYVVVERKNPLKPQNPTKFYAMARSNRRMGDLGSFRVTIATGNATDTAKEFKAATCIRISRVRFSPGEMLRDMCKAMKYSLYKADAEEGNGDTPKPDEKPGGGSTGGDDDEAPDPTV